MELTFIGFCFLNWLTSFIHALSSLDSILALVIDLLNMTLNKIEFKV